MASVCYIFPQLILIRPLPGRYPHAQNPPTRGFDGSFLLNQHSSPRANAKISCNLPLGSSFTTDISVGHSLERRISTAVSSSKVDRAVSGIEEGSPLISEGGFVGQNEEEKGGNLVGCKTCGKPEIERGCNGEGSIQGGIGTIPGFTWWPIKVYRPCPSFIASGGRYKRRGQSMDEVAFGRRGKDDDVDKKERPKRRLQGRSRLCQTMENWGFGYSGSLAYRSFLSNTLAKVLMIPGSLYDICTSYWQVPIRELTLLTTLHLDYMSLQPTQESSLKI